MRLPDFIIIGAAKAGTTSLYALLDRHPGIFMPQPKEPEFFARDDHYARGIDSYAKLFETAHPDQVVGEASTLYSLAPFFDQTAPRMAAHIPSVKLIYVLREPVSRAYSFYVQLVKNYQNVTGDKVVHRSFEDFIDPNQWEGGAPRDKVLSPANAHLPDAPELCLAGSDYLTQIAAYDAHFPPEQILFIRFEDFVANRAATLRQITDFLGVAPVPETVFADKSATQNVSKDHFDALETQIAVQDLKSRMGGLWALKGLLPSGAREWVKQTLMGKNDSRKGHAAHVPPPMQPETKAKLKARYAQSRAALEARTGLDLSGWGA